MQTRRDTALAWTGATVYGDCTAHLALSVADPVLAPEGGPTGSCRALRQQTAANREAAAQMGIDLLAVRRSGSEVTATPSIRRPDGEQQVELPRRRNGDGWAVIRAPEVCADVGCP